MHRDVASWFICHSLPYFDIALSTLATGCHWTCNVWRITMCEEM